MHIDCMELTRISRMTVRNKVGGNRLPRKPKGIVRSVNIDIKTMLRVKTQKFQITTINLIFTKMYAIQEHADGI